MQEIVFHYICAMFIVLAAFTLPASGQDCVTFTAEYGFPCTSGTNQADASVAIGNNLGIAVSNWQIVSFNNQNEIDSKDFAEFFSDGGIGVDGDGVIRYDSDSNRFFLIADTGDFAIAVSKTSTPALDANGWFFFDYTLQGGHHYQNLAIESEHVFISMLTSGDPTRPLIGALNKSDLINGTQTTLVSTQLAAFQAGQHRVGCVHDYDRASDIGYFVAPSHLSGQANSFIRLYAADPSAMSNPEHYDLTVDDYLTPPDSVINAGSPNYTIADDMKTSVLRNGHIWTAHTIGVQGQSDESKVRWYEIDLDHWPAQGSTPSVVQSGTIDPGQGVSACYPAVSVDAGGNMAISWNQCSSSEYVSIYRAIRRHDDAAGTLRASLLFKAVTGAPGSGNFASDYAMMDEDPSDSGVFWTHNMYYDTERRTWLGRIDVNRSLTLAVSPVSDPIHPGDTITLTTSGAEPGDLVRWWYSSTGCGSTFISGLNLTLDIDSAVYIAQKSADADGSAVKIFTVPLNFATGDYLLQAGEYENSSEVVTVTVH